MAKFRIRFKIQAMELEIDGEREDIPALSSAIRQQFGGLVEPAETLANDKQLANESTKTIEAETVKPAAKSPRKRGKTTTATDGATTQPIDFRHDSAKYGSPSQSWNLTEKSIWLLEVIEGITGNKEVAGAQIAATFNHYFKPAGKVHPPNVTMMLGKAKVLNPAPVGEDKGMWFLTAQGHVQAKALIKSVLNTAA